MSRKIEDVIRDISEEADKARGVAAQRRAEKQKTVNEEEARQAERTRELKLLSTLIMTQLAIFERELSKIVRAHVVERPLVRPGRGTLTFGALVFQVPSTIGTDAERWGSVGFMLREATATDPDRVSVLINANCGENGVGGVEVEYDVLPAATARAGSTISDAIVRALDKARTE